MQNKKLLIVYSPGSPAAEFVLQGVNMDEVGILKMQLKKSFPNKILYFIFYKLSLFKLSAHFRFASDFRKRLSEQDGKILFWDCCDLFLYKLLFAVCKQGTNKSIFFWNPLGFHKAERVSVNTMLGWLKKQKISLSTFDPEDSKRYDLPLYYNVNRKVDVVEKKKDCDFYFVGLPKGREKELDKLRATVESKGYKTKFIMPKDKSEYISQMQNIQFSAKTRCIVDLVSAKYDQSGLTLRPFDAMFLEKKLLSNCKSLMNYDFFNKNNIFIFTDETNGDEIDDFMKRPYKEIDKEIVNRYEINNWLRKYYLS